MFKRIRQELGHDVFECPNCFNRFTYEQVKEMEPCKNCEAEGDEEYDVEKHIVCNHCKTCSDCNSFHCECGEVVTGELMECLSCGSISVCSNCGVCDECNFKLTL